MRRSSAVASWCITYLLSYRDSRRDAERGIVVRTLRFFVWVQSLCGRSSEARNDSHDRVNNFLRVEETRHKVGESGIYLIGFDKAGKTVDFSASSDRSMPLHGILRKALSRCLPRWRAYYALMVHKQSHLALRYLRRGGSEVKVRSCKDSRYLNNHD